MPPGKLQECRNLRVLRRKPKHLRVICVSNATGSRLDIIAFLDPYANGYIMFLKLTDYRVYQACHLTRDPA